MMSGVCSPSSPGMGVAVGGSAAAAPGGNPNLLLWTEAIDNAIWAKTGAVIAANTVTDPLSGATADRATYDPDGVLTQASTTAAATGAATAEARSASATWGRFSLTGTFDGLPYTFSIYAKGEGISFRMGILRSSGVLAVQIANPDDIAPITLDLWGAQLEQAAAASLYQQREGA